MKKHVLLFSTSLFLFACNNSAEPAPSISEEPDKNNTIETEIVMDQGFGNEFFILSDTPTIADYAEYFLESKIYKNSEEMAAANNTGEKASYYYETIDEKNGFATVVGAFEGSYTFAVWHMENGEDLVGKTSVGCGPVCDYSFEFYQVRAQLVNVVTTDIVPIDEINKHQEKMLAKLTKKHEVDDHNPQLKFVLPQKGTSIDVYLSVDANEYEFPILRLDWNKEEFFIGEKYEEIPG